MPAKVVAIFAVPAVAALALFGAIGLLWWPLALLAIPAALALPYLMWRRADSVVLRSLDVRPLAEREGARILNIVSKLSLASGIEQPDVVVIDSQARNLASVSGRRNTLVVTSGLVASLDVLEMEGVVAHGLMKATSDAAFYETLVASGGAIVLPFQRKLARRWGGGDEGVIRFDISGVGLTRYPPGLRDALQRIKGGETDIAGTDALGTAWLVPPLPQRIPLDHRIEVLWEL